MMTNSGLKCLFASDDLKQAVVGMMKAAATEETMLAHMLDVENEMLDQARKISANLEEFVAVNESVHSILRSLNKVQMMTQIKLQYLDELLERVEEPDGEDGNLEE